MKKWLADGCVTSGRAPITSSPLRPPTDKLTADKHVNYDTYSSSFVQGVLGRQCAKLESSMISDVSVTDVDEMWSSFSSSLSSSSSASSDLPNPWDNGLPQMESSALSRCFLPPCIAAQGPLHATHRTPADSTVRNAAKEKPRSRLIRMLGIRRSIDTAAKEIDVNRNIS